MMIQNSQQMVDNSFFRFLKAMLNDFGLRYRDNEPTASASVFIMLFHNLLGEIPSKKQNIIGHIIYKPRRRENWEVIPTPCTDRA
jgi:hypothetical protein